MDPAIFNMSKSELMQVFINLIGIILNNFMKFFRVVFRTQSKSYDGAFLQKQPLTIFTKKLHRKCSTGF